MASQTGKEVVKAFFSGENVPWLPFMPWIFSFAAKLEQVSLQQLFMDSRILSRAIRNVYQLYRCDAIVGIFDPSLEAEACGCAVQWESESLPTVVSHPLAQGVNLQDLDLSKIVERGRIPIVVEAIKQLQITVGREVAIAAVISGPLTLGSHLAGEELAKKWQEDPQRVERIIDFASKIIIKICRKYCELDVDVIVIADRMLAEVNLDLLKKIAGFLKPAWNVVRFFRSNSIVLTKECSNELQAKTIFSLGADAVVLGAETPENVAVSVNEEGKFGIGLAKSVLCGDKLDVQAAVRPLLDLKLPENCFLTTEWEVPLDVPVENMYELASILQQHRGI